VVTTKWRNGHNRLVGARKVVAKLGKHYVEKR
jgi:hypothetical protein